MTDRWRLSAACRGTDINLWFDPDRVDEAKVVCKACPVAVSCRSDAAGEWGVWAGRWHGPRHNPLIEDDPSDVDASFTSTSGFLCGVDPRCGTPTGYKRGGRCPECKSAIRDSRNRRLRAFTCPDDEGCGSYARYQHGCRLPRCAEAKRLYNRLNSLQARKKSTPYQP